jgi:EAL domain-containing protein (putative c-di-GMP-specific phosphodiesterase class I)
MELNKMYDLSYNFVGFIFLVILTGYFLYRPIFPNLSNKYYRLILIVSVLAVGLNTLTAYTINNSNNYPVQLNYVLNTLFFLFNWTLPFVFYQYSIILIKNKKYFTGKFHTFLWVYYIIQSLIVLSTPFTHLVIYFDANLVYHHGLLYIAMASINFLLLGFSGIIVILYGQKMPTIQRVIIPIYTFMLIGFNFVQLLYPLLFIDGLILSIATFLMFLTLQNPTSYYDTLTNNYSRATFLEYLAILTMQNKAFQIIIIDVVSTSTINKTFGEKVGTEIIYKTGQKVKWASHHNLTFRMDGDIFIVVTFSLSERDKVLNNLEMEFPFKQKYNDDYTYDANVHLNYTNSLHNFEDIDEAYQIIIESIKISKERNLTLINTGTVDSIKKSRKIEATLKKSIENHDVEIYLQPIVNTKSKKVTNAEALVRLYDSELGLIMPDEFIPMAEKDGNITKLSPLIIEGVCKYLSENTLPDSFKKISINLSVIDCLNPNLDKLVLNILKKYNIEPSRIIFEVTETVASLAPQLKDTMINIKAAGSTFALDDFGSGYANLDSVIKLPFDIIKIDRQLLLLMHNDQYKTMFSGIMDTLHSLNLETIVEGIETEDQAGIVRNVKGTYQQGYLYSKPLSMEDFTIYINSTN